MEKPLRAIGISFIRLFVVSSQDKAALSRPQIIPKNNVRNSRGAIPDMWAAAVSM